MAKTLPTPPQTGKAYLQWDASTGAYSWTTSLDVEDTSVGFVATINNLSTSSVADGLQIEIGTGAANVNNFMIEFRDAGGNIGEVAGNGTGVNYSTTSDQRLKRNIRSAENWGLQKLGEIQVREWEWIKNSEPGLGFIAQELLPIWPHAVNNPEERNRGLAESDPEYRYMSVDYSKLTPLLVKAVQELSAKVQTLETELAELKAR